MLLSSGKLFKFKQESKGVSVYADDSTIVCNDDSTIVCKTIEELREVIAIIENYCDVFDIKINEMKIKWMVFGYEHEKIQPVIKVNGLAIDKVDEFKFLGLTISNKGAFKSHNNKRKQVCLAGVGEITRLGFNENISKN